MNPRGARTGRASGGRAAAAPDPQASATTGREAKLWQSADMLRNNMDVAECKHIVLGLIFLKYISDAFGVFGVGAFSGRGRGQLGVLGLAR